MDDSLRSPEVVLRFLRRASRVEFPKTLAYDWEKLYVLSIDSLRKLRSFSLSHEEMQDVFEEVVERLESSHARALPLFGDGSGSLDPEEFSDILDDIKDHLESAESAAKRFQKQAKAELDVWG